MKDMIDNGYAEKAPDDDNLKPGMTFYINHHGTRHPKKKKLRIVFNCSQEYSGESLNKYLIQGPLLTNDLTGVLLDSDKNRSPWHVTWRECTRQPWTSRPSPFPLVGRQGPYQRPRRLSHDSSPVWRHIIPKLRQLCAEANRERLRGRIWRASSRLYPKWFLCWWWFEVSSSHSASVSGGAGKECRSHVSLRWFQSPQVVIQQQRRNQEHPRKWDNWGCQRNKPRVR